MEEAKAVSLPAAKIEALLKSPISYCKNLADEIKTLKETYETKKLETKETFEDYIRNANRSQETLKMLALRIETILHNNRIYDYNYVETEFNTIYQAIHEMKDTY
ncbi:hypothetical protein ACIQXV_11785 [Neobacillus sp. NPDC097160]|uniref:hypothetical protein n=1 Tax=Neobacillus sp. NPDC097160 TaxID=3364298 RepID=UPI0037F1369E